MTKNHKIAVTVSVIILLSGAGYLIYNATRKKKLPTINPVTDLVKKSETKIPASINPPTPKNVYAAINDVRINDIYNGYALKSANKGDLIGTLQGDKDSLNYFVNTRYGKAFVTKSSVTIK